MKKIPLLILGLALTACAPQTSQVSQVRVHEALIYGQVHDHLAWVYGELSGAKSTINIAGQTQELRPGNPQDPLYTPQSLMVGGRAVFTSSSSTQVSLPVSVLRQNGGQYLVTAVSDLSAVYLLENGQWFSLTGGLSAASSVQTVATPLDAGSLGNLTGAEASALARALAPQGALVVSVLPTLSESTFTVTPKPAETLTTALYVQPVSVVTSVVTTSADAVPSAATTPGATPMPNTVSPAHTASNNFRTVASGSSAAATTPSVQLASTQSSFDAIWNMAYGRQSPMPVTPLLGNQSAVGIFLGTRPTGGYGVQVDSVQPAGNTLTVRVTLKAPGAGTITTQSITSPWVIFSVSGKYSDVQVIDQSGQQLK